MKIPFIIYAEALGIYMLVTLYALKEPFIYMISAWYALVSGFAAMVIFIAVFVLLRSTCASLRVIKTILYITVLAAVAIAYKLLLVVTMSHRSFLGDRLGNCFPAGCCGFWLVGC